MQKSSLGFALAVAGVVAVSIAAYAHALPPWIAPGNADKVFHFAMGGILALFLDAALRRRAAWSSSLAPPLSSVLILVPLGLDEYLQRYSAVRTSSIWDFAADVLGVVVFTLLSRRLLVPVSSRVAAWHRRPRPLQRS